jgi:hypothetical protein
MDDVDIIFLSISLSGIVHYYSKQMKYTFIRILLELCNDFLLSIDTPRTSTPTNAR